MTDRGKVLKGVECCSKRGRDPFANQQFCEECPYCQSASCARDLLKDIKKQMIEQDPGRAQWFGLYSKFLWTDDEKEREKLKEQTLDALGQELVRQKNLVRICYLDEPTPMNGVRFGSIGVKLKAEPLEEATTQG